MMASKVEKTNYEDRVLDNNEWIDFWAIGDIGFHQAISDPFLDNNEKGMFEGKTKSIFVPLCGKTLDMLWMYNKGHTVCGVEIAEQAIKDFFEEHNIDKDIEEIENIGTLYKSKDGRIKLYAADALVMSPTLCGQFDIIWDSKSFVAINLADHQLYRDAMLGLMKPGGAYYLATFEYDPAVWPGPPHTLTDKTVKDVYGEKCTIYTMEEKENDNQFPFPEVVDKTKYKHFSNVGPALRSSSYLYSRWYKINFK